MVAVVVVVVSVCGVWSCNTAVCVCVGVCVCVYSDGDVGERAQHMFRRRAHVRHGRHVRRFVVYTLISQIVCTQARPTPNPNPVVYC